MTIKFYRTNLKENAIDDLKKLSEFLKLSRKNNSYWKWVIIALHGSLYKFMILALKNSDCSGIWEHVELKNNGIIDWGNSKNKLISFPTAFRWIKDARRMGSKPFVSNLEIDESIGKLNNALRNNFMHFDPKEWSIEIKLIEKIIKDTLPIIRFLILCSGRIRTESEQEEQSINELLNKIKF